MKRATWILSAGILSLAGLSLAGVDIANIGSGSGRTSSSTYDVRYSVGRPAIGQSRNSDYLAQAGNVWQQRIGTAVPDDQTPGRVARLFLHEPAPNPFNPQTSIRFETPEPGARVALRIYNVTGRLVRVLFDGPVTTTTTTVRWDGRDGSGQTVSSGVYLVQLRGSSKEMTRRVTLLK